MVEVQDVHRAYGDVVAVAGVSFRVAGGEVVGLLGPNGAGKTTTLRMLATLLRPDQGTIRVCGYDNVEEALAVRGCVGYQTGDTGLYGRLTPVEFLRYFGRLQGMSPELVEARVAKAVADFEIEPFATRRCGGLSTGQTQRVSLARASLHEPQVFILDEPTAGLDIVASSFVLDTLRRARSEGRAVLFSTHIISEVELVADRVLVMHEGRIVARGTVEELLRESGCTSLARAYMALIGRTGRGAAQGAPTPGPQDAEGER